MGKHIKHGLKPGTRINLTRKGNKDYIYSSQVSEVNGDEVTVLGPMKRGRFVYIPKKTAIKIAYTKQGRGTFHIDAITIESSNEGIYLIKLKVISDEVLQQNRSNFRVENRIPVEIIYTSRNDVVTENTETLDLSAGGMRIYSNINFERDDEVIAILRINSGDIKTKGRVVRKLSSNHTKFQHVYAISFEDLPEQDEDFIVKYLFDLQSLMSSEGRFK